MTLYLQRSNYLSFIAALMEPRWWQNTPQTEAPSSSMEFKVGLLFKQKDKYSVRAHDL